jgi:outer membrane beta-barrel protein
MESRIQYLFLTQTALRKQLTRVLCSICLLTMPWAVSAQDYGDESEDALGQIISPDLERRTIREDMIDSENFELGVFYGLLSIEDFGSNAVMGITLAYHITEDFFVEAAYGVSKTEKTSYELLSGGVELLTDDERDLDYYNLSLGYNLFSGQFYPSAKRAINTRFYIIAGAGNTEFAAQKYFTYNLGAGLRLFATDWISADLSLRNHAFEHEIFGEQKTVNNLESRIGLSLFF